MTFSRIAWCILVLRCWGPSGENALKIKEWQADELAMLGFPCEMLPKNLFQVQPQFWWDEFLGGETLRNAPKRRCWKRMSLVILAKRTVLDFWMPMISGPTARAQAEPKSTNFENRVSKDNIELQSAKMGFFDVTFCDVNLFFRKFTHRYTSHIIASCRNRCFRWEAEATEAWRTRRTSASKWIPRYEA